MLRKSFLSFLLLTMALGNHGALPETSQEINAGSCGLYGIPDNTSPTNLYMLPPFPDNLRNTVKGWEHPTFGAVTRVTVSADPTAHTAYLTASFSAISFKYWISGNTKTQNFVKEQKTRSMKRYVTLHCTDGTASPRYHLGITFQDMEAPKFAEEEYTFNITKDWDRQDRPISDGQFVIVSDNALELESDKDKLIFEASEDIIKVKIHPLWVLSYPSKYYFRLDLFLKDGMELTAGDTFEVYLYAREDFNSGVTKIKINVGND